MHLPFADRDPGRIVLRRAARVGVSVPLVLAVMLATASSTAATFAAFATFSALAFADYAGAPLRRSRSYLGLTAFGAILVAVGTACNANAVTAVLGTVVAVFVVSMAATLGGPWAGGRFAAILAFVLAVTVPAPFETTPERLLGWTVGGLAALVAALILFPVRERLAIRRHTARAARAVAARIRAAAAGADDGGAAGSALETLRTHILSTPYRPAGPAQADRALLALAGELRRANRYLDRVEMGAAPTPDADIRLATCAADVLDEVGDALDTGGDPAAAGSALEAARNTHARAVVRWAERAARDEGPGPAVAGIDRSFGLRLVARMTAFACRSATEVTGHGPTEAPLDRSHLSTPRSTVGLVTPHLTLKSVTLRNSIRTAIGLAIAVGVGTTFDLDHAFWIALAALSVLRSNAVGTARTAVEAVLGTLLGFAIIGPFVTIVGDARPALWVLLPVVCFLATYTPDTIHFAIGQASFTMTVVVLFNLIEPEGWETGLVRLENVAIGAAVGVAVGALLWPRGAASALRAALGDAYRALARALDASVTDRVDLQGIGGVDATARRADDALRQLLVEAPNSTPRAPYGALVAGVADLQHGADSARLLVDDVGASGATVPEVDGELHRVATRLRALAAAVEDLRGARLIPAPADEDRRVRTIAATAYLRSQGRIAIEAVWACDWIEVLDGAIDDLGAAIAALPPPTRSD